MNSHIAFALDMSLFTLHSTRKAPGFLKMALANYQLFSHHGPLLDQYLLRANRNPDDLALTNLDELTNWLSVVSISFLL